MSDPTYHEALDAAYQRMTRGEADDAIYGCYLDGRMTADEYIAYLRDELHDAWRQLYERNHPDVTEEASR